MSNEYGKVLGQALRAVRKMHEETAELLRDCDRLMKKQGYESIFGNEVTNKTTSKRLDASNWMLDGLSVGYRRTRSANGHALFLTVVFDEEEVPEPLLLVADLDYGEVSEAEIDERANRWDAFENTPFWPEVVASLGEPDGFGQNMAEGTNARAIRYVAVALVSITSLEDIQKLIDIVLAYTPPDPQ